jgi:hypothetical protein
MRRAAHPRRELDFRVVDGLEISLLWDPHTNDVCVDVCDLKRGAVFEIPVPPGATALDVFSHPYAYPAAKVSTMEKLFDPPPAMAARE